MTRSLLVALLLLAPGCGLLPRDPHARVLEVGRSRSGAMDLEARNVTVAEVLSAIARATGDRIAAEPAVATRAVDLEVEDEPWLEVVRRIAVEAGGWVQRDAAGVLVLRDWGEVW